MAGPVLFCVIARSEVTKPRPVGATARFAHLLMNSSGLSLRARLGGRGNPAEIPDGSPRRFAPRDDKRESSLPSTPKAPRLGQALAMTRIGIEADLP